MTEQQPTAGACRAVEAILADKHEGCREDWAAIIDRETGLPELVAICRDIAAVFSLTSARDVEVIKRIQAEAYAFLDQYEKEST